MSMEKEVTHFIFESHHLPHAVICAMRFALSLSEHKTLIPLYTICRRHIESLLRCVISLPFRFQYLTLRWTCRAITSSMASFSLQTLGLVILSVSVSEILLWTPVGVSAMSHDDPSLHVSAVTTLKMGWSYFFFP